MPSRRLRSNSFANTRSRIRARSNLPDWSSAPLPNVLTISRNAGVPGSTTSRAIWSVSMTGTPSSANIAATALLPLAMPPVSPISSAGGTTGRRLLLVRTRLTVRFLGLALLGAALFDTDFLRTAFRSSRGCRRARSFGLLFHIVRKPLSYCESSTSSLRQPSSSRQLSHSEGGLGQSKLA